MPADCALSTWGGPEKIKTFSGRMQCAAKVWGHNTESYREPLHDFKQEKNMMR